MSENKIIGFIESIVFNKGSDNLKKTYIIIIILIIVCVGYC
jgi:hypothetical protein